MLNNKRIFIFADEHLSKRISDYFIVIPETLGNTSCGYSNFSYAYHTDNEFTTMMKHPKDTNLYMADYFFIDYSFLKNCHEVLDMLRTCYQKPIICIFNSSEESSLLQKEISFHIYMDTFDQDIKQCIRYLDD